MSNILIVDDEAEMRTLIAMYLQNSGFVTFEASDAKAMRRCLEANSIDLILLDIMLPDQDGFEICAELRKTSLIPIIFLTAKGEEWDKVKGLQLGADDYIVKPFSPGELVARMDAVMRRTSLPRKTGAEIEIGLVQLDVERRKLFVSGQEVHATYKEFELLALMMGRPGKVFTREELLETVWDMGYQGGLRTVDTHMKTLRMKLGKGAGHYIQTVWGCGYKFEVQK